MFLALWTEYHDRHEREYLDAMTKAVTITHYVLMNHITDNAAIAFRIVADDASTCDSTAFSVVIGKNSSGQELYAAVVYPAIEPLSPDPIPEDDFVVVTKENAAAAAAKKAAPAKGKGPAKLEDLPSKEHEVMRAFIRGADAGTPEQALWKLFEASAEVVQHTSGMLFGRHHDELHGGGTFCTRPGRMGEGLTRRKVVGAEQ